jgi:phosphatidylethanolamine/phosphatidyl-N-methylethanolamine N-methyltransferase
MNDSTLFLSKFLRQGTAIASIAPSSRFLARTTLCNIDWPRVSALVELGAGTGPITRVIAERARPDCRVLVLERDPDFVRLLRARFGELANFEIVAADASSLASICAQRGFSSVDHVISGLPVPSFPRELQQELFGTVASVLRADGTYNQITEIPWIFWGFYRRFFHQVQFRFELLNLPPAGAYLCRSPKPVS